MHNHMLFEHHLKVIISPDTHFIFINTRIVDFIFFEIFLGIFNFLVRRMNQVFCVPRNKAHSELAHVKHLRIAGSYDLYTYSVSLSIRRNLVEQYITVLFKITAITNGPRYLRFTCDIRSGPRRYLEALRTLLTYSRSSGRRLVRNAVNCMLNA